SIPTEFSRTTVVAAVAPLGPAPTINASNIDTLIAKIEFRGGFCNSQYAPVKCPGYQLELKTYITIVFYNSALPKFVRPFFRTCESTTRSDVSGELLRKGAAQNICGFAVIVCSWQTVTAKP